MVSTRRGRDHSIESRPPRKYSKLYMALPCAGDPGKGSEEDSAQPLGGFKKCNFLLPSNKFLQFSFFPITTTCNTNSRLLQGLPRICGVTRNVLSNGPEGPESPECSQLSSGVGG